MVHTPDMIYLDQRLECLLRQTLIADREDREFKLTKVVAKNFIQKRKPGSIDTMTVQFRLFFLPAFSRHDSN